MWLRKKEARAAGPEMFGDETLLETRLTAAKRQFVWASVLFALMFLTVAGLGSLFIIKDLGDKEVMKMLRGYSTELEALIAKMPKTEIYKGYQQKTVVTTQIDEFLIGKQVFDSVELYDERGKLIYQQSMPREGELALTGAPTGLKPGQQRVETKSRLPIEMPVPIGPGKMGKAVLSVSEEVLARQASTFRKELATKLVLVIAVILLLVCLAYLYVLRVLAMTRRIEAEFQNQKRLSYLGLLSSGLAHEIKNPLNSIQMNLQLLEEEISAGAPAEQTASWIEPIKKEIRRLERLVNDFLTFARPIKPEFKPTELRAVLDSLATLVASEARAKEVSIHVEAAPDLPAPETDENLLRTAMLNLLLNAIQSSPGPGDVIVRAAADGTRLVLEVEDEGPGIPRERWEEIFQLFYTTKPGGTGLGLPIARRLVESLRGTLEVCEKEGTGACFRLVLPLEGAAA